MERNEGAQEMEKSRMALTLALVFLIAGVLSAPTALTPSIASATHGSNHLAGLSHGSVPAVTHSRAPTPMAGGFPRTVLVETFTGVWCIHCPAESQALYKIDQNTNRNVLAIAELHTCAFAPPQPCLENYVPPDNTTNSRGSWYNVCGFPDVFFDGQHDACGASDSEPQMQNQYQDQIANASMFPGNVSISQTATISYGNVKDHAVINSALEGNFSTITYLLEYIGKRNVSNGYGPHDLGWVVRSTILNHPQHYTLGGTTELNITGAIDPAWNHQNLSVITFVQNNSTKIVENANFALVESLATSVSGTPTSLPAGNSSTITVLVTNTSTGLGVSGASINLSSSIGGVLNPTSGVTAFDGSFTSTFTAPKVTATEEALITAQATAANYTDSTGAIALIVTPVFPPTVPTGLSVSPGTSQIALNWTAPLSGGGGVTYHVYRATTSTGSYSPVDITTSTTYVDTLLDLGQSYWYEVNAQGSGGFSPNTTAVAASPVTAVAHGLPPGDGWWLAIASQNFTSPTFAPISLYLGDGFYSYAFGPGSYAFVAPEPFGDITVAGAALSFDADFSARFATLQGTVTPTGASVSLNGTAITVTDGSFSELEEAGVYSLVVTSPGYQTNTTIVTLTPGNTSNLDFNLARVQPGGGGVVSSNGGLSGDVMIALIAVAAVIAVAAILGGIMLSRRGKRTPPARPPRRGPRPPPGSD
jgi:hypothetical protein